MKYFLNISKNGQLIRLMASFVFIFFQWREILELRRPGQRQFQGCVIAIELSPWEQSQGDVKGGLNIFTPPPQI